MADNFHLSSLFSIINSEFAFIYLFRYVSKNQSLFYHSLNLNLFIIKGI